MGTGYIDERGKYQKGKKKPLAHDVNPTYKQWHGDLERKQYSKEIIQPHKNGKPNPDFVRAYRDDDVLKEYLTIDQIDKIERDML